MSHIGKYFRQCAIVFAVVTLSSCVVDQNAGTGPLELNYKTEANYRNYLNLRWPQSFAVSTDGNHSFGIYCSNSVSCQGTDYAAIAACESRSQGVPCKIYARSSTVVWSGPISIRPAVSEKPAQPQNTKPNESGSTYPITVAWDIYPDVIMGTITFAEAHDGKKIFFQLPKDDGSCQGNFHYDTREDGFWAVSCANGMAASGAYKGEMANKRANGSGHDTKGRLIRFSLAPETAPLKQFASPNIPSSILDRDYRSCLSTACRNDNSTCEAFCTCIVEKLGELSTSAYFNFSSRIKNETLTKDDLLTMTDMQTRCHR